MRCQELNRYKQRLDHLFKKASFFNTDLELQSHWAQYLCILVYGFLEVGVREIFTEYAQNKTVLSPNISNFVARKIRFFQNPNMKVILELVASFSSDWESGMHTFCADKFKDHIDSIVNNRNKIAHGQSVELTVNRVKEYYESIIMVLEEMERLCEN